ncbi:MAG: hypothetical protein AB7F88_03200 [Pyrinomonadaceae bacterium]
MSNRKRLYLLSAVAGAALIAFAAIIGLLYFTFSGGIFAASAVNLERVTAVADPDNKMGEPFGIAVLGSDIYVSDGSRDTIWRLPDGGTPVAFATGLSTPSAIAFDDSGNLIVADTGSHTIKKVDKNGVVSLLAGTEGEFGDQDGPALSAKFNGPVGLAVLKNGSIVVADTYNDKVKLILNGEVTTLAGSTRGFADGQGAAAKFDTPCAVLGWPNGSILVGDTMNGRIRIINSNGTVSTIAGRSEPEIRDGPLAIAAFDRPYALAADPDGSLFIGDNNAVRVIRNRPLPIVETLSENRRGFTDGALRLARFHRVSGIAVTDDYDVFIADSDNSAVRRIGPDPDTDVGGPQVIFRDKQTDPVEFRARQPARWPYDPPDVKRDIAGTLGEIRGEVVDSRSQVWFHNGLDIAGGYGEKARFIRDETVLDPISVDNFNTLRELLRLPSVGYIHIRLGRDASGRPLGDNRFQFDPGMTGVRVRRGTTFHAGDVVGTLNPMNHVHLIAGPRGDEMNALDALVLPGVADTIEPTIEDIAFFDETWQPLETKGPGKRISLAGKVRIVVRAFDRMDGNPERRRLGVYRLGYQVLRPDGSAIAPVSWNITFDRNPSPDAVKFVYAPGSRSGATGETVFRYIVTNTVNGDSFSEGFLDPARFGPGEYVLRVFAADYFGNTVSSDIIFEASR